MPSLNVECCYTHANTNSTLCATSICINTTQMTQRCLKSFPLRVVRRQCTALSNGLQNRLTAVAIFDLCLVSRFAVSYIMRLLTGPRTKNGHKYFTSVFCVRHSRRCEICCPESVLPLQQISRYVHTELLCFAVCPINSLVAC